MRLQALTVLAAVGHSVHAFTDTSPFFFFSTSELLLPSASSIQSAASLSTSLRSSLNQCPSQFYFIVTQEGVSPGDFANRRTAPSLSRWISGQDKSIRSSTAVSDVVGVVDKVEIGNLLSKQCGAKIEDVDMMAESIPVVEGASPKVFNVEFPAPVASKKTDSLLANDAFLASIIDSLPSQDYTVVFTTTSSKKSSQIEHTSYEMDSSLLQEPMHSDLKRDLGAIQTRASVNYTLPDGALFDRYQYLTPGLFMGFLVALPLLSILYVAIRAVSSLQVSYAAFEKETGPQSGSKKQQ